MNDEKDGFVEWAKVNGLAGEIDVMVWERRAFAAGVEYSQKQKDCASEGLNWQKLYYQSKSDVLNEILTNCSGLHHANGSYVLAQIKKMVETAEACKEPLEAKVREGWKLVPIEPTKEMQESGSVSIFESSFYDSKQNVISSLWEAMLSAAPQPTSCKQPGTADK